MKKCITILLLIFIIGCKKNEINTTEKLDLVAFKKNIHSGNSFIRNDSIISLNEKQGIYVIERRHKQDSLVVNMKVFDNNTLFIKWNGNIIWNAAGPIYIGVSTSYNEEGKIRTRDNDKKFYYPVIDLIKKLEKNYNLKIYRDKKTYFLFRDYDKVLYQVCFYKNNNIGFRVPYWIIFDGITGNFIKEERMPLVD